MLHLQSNRNFLVGGVSSPVRSFAAVGSRPLEIVRGRGAYIWDNAGQRYLDFVLGFGSQILGHSPACVASVLRADQGSQFGLNALPEAELAARIARDFPSIAKVRFVTSGSEATQLAVRIARAATTRSKVLTFANGYHGHALAADSELVSIPAFDLAALQQTIAKHKPAALLAELVLGNSGCVPPPAGFWRAAAKLLQVNKVLLIADEVMTGYRAAYPGWQVIEKIQPDLTCLGKIIGGGMPLAAVGGRAKLMNLLTPVGTVRHAGTFAGHPLACAAGLAALTQLEQDWPRLSETAAWLGTELVKIVPTSTHSGAMFWLGLAARDYKRIFWQLAKKGFLLPPDSVESFFISTRHSRSDLNKFLIALGQALSSK